MKITTKQASLLEAMKGGVVVRLMIHPGYCFRSDDFTRCTAQVNGLLRRGLIEEYDRDWRGAKYRPTTETPKDNPTDSNP
jgi:hypothetical protein